MRTISYHPISQKPIILDPEKFNARKGILTKYGKKLLVEGERFYRRLSIDDLDSTNYQRQDIEKEESIWEGI